MNWFLYDRAFVVNELKKMNSIARFLKISKQKSLYSNETWIKINN